MNKEQLDIIKRITKHDYSDIITMNDMSFWKHITVCLAKGTLTPQQHDYLDKQRTGNGLEQETIYALELFGGKLIK